VLNVKFFGVRGSTPCPADRNQRYGGNTSCVALESPGVDPIVLDLGTGLRYWGETLPLDGSFSGSALVTHLHWDHVQGLPFFVPVLRDGARLQVFGAAPDGRRLEDCFRTFMSPPFFPISIDDLPGEISFTDVFNEDFVVGDAKVMVRRVPHVGLTCGYRIEMGGATVAYISDHQMPADGQSIAPEVLELASGADLLIHDAQYTPAEFAKKATWGHCTVDYAVHVAASAGVKRLALFHHDPEHDDVTIDGLLAGAIDLTGDRIGEVFAASEGLTVVL
jgi:phosphoribosyl 1,2-cyclic phosphodiesterase